jgi:putative ABC transport system permease protein
MHDLRFAVRLLLKDRLVTLVAIVTLALGIAANSTVFTCVNAVLLRGLPYAHADRIVHLGTRTTSVPSGRDGVSYLEYQDLRAQARTFQALGAWRDGTMNVSDADHVPERLSGTWLSSSAFELLGQQPLIGRRFTAADERPDAEAVVILGHGVWTDRYAADRSILGRTIRINETPATVIGVMPAGVKFPVVSDVWQPLVPSADDLAKRGNRRLQVFGTLRDGSSLAQAQGEMATIFGRFTAQYPDTNKDIVADMMPYNDRFNGGPIRLVFLAMMGAVAFVLLIACANVANLMLARSGRRAREMAVRVSLGATRWRIARQLLVESVLVAVAAGALGLALSAVGIRLFDRAVEGTGKPYWILFTIDYRVLAFLFVVCLVTAVLSALAPALYILRTDAYETLKEGGRGGSAGRGARRFTSALVVGELVLTVVLLSGAGLMIRSFLTLYRMDFGIRTERVLTMRMMLAERKYPAAPDWMAFHDRLADRLSGVPGLQSAALASTLPLMGGEERGLQFEGRPAPAGTKDPRVTVVSISPAYFETLELTLRAGRAFRPDDGRPGAEAAIVNERWVERFSPRQQAVGRRIRLKAETETPWLTVVGVSPSVQQRNALDEGESTDPVVYIPFRQEPARSTFLLARGAADPGSLAKVVREEVRGVDADQPVFRVMSMADALAQSRWPYRVFGGLLGIFAVIALVLSAVGIYAVTAYSVAQRTQEIGVRMALGANSNQVTWLVLRRAAMQMAVGLALGLGAALGVARVLRSILVKSTANDPTTYVVVVAIFVVVTVVASVLPSRRATRLDPLAVLRAE